MLKSLNSSISNMMAYNMEKHIKSLVCTLCYEEITYQPHILTCPNCGEKGILDIKFDYGLIKKRWNQSILKKNNDFSMFRYMPLLSILKKPKGLLKIGFTPLYMSQNLKNEIGISKLYIKDECVNPSGSLKDRASIIAVIKATELNKPFISCSSTGNAASSLACHAAKMGLKTVIFVPKRAPIGKLNQLSIYGANVISVNGDYKATYELSKQSIDHYGWYNRNAAINPHLVEGKKTVALEIAEQLDFKPTDWVVVSVGDGCTIAGVYKGFYDLFMLNMITKIPKLLGVQSEGCSPFVDSFIENRPIVEAKEETIADSISVGIPRNPIKAMHAVKASLGSFIKVSDQNILDAMKLLGKHEGIFAEPAASASLSGLIEAMKQNIIKKSESVTIIITGNGLKDPVNAKKASDPPVVLDNDLNQVITYLEKGEN
jgi:threonine synthase